MRMTPELVAKANHNTLYHTVGIRLLEAADGKSQVELSPRPEVCWPFPGQAHGGMLFTVMDTSMAWAYMSLLEPGQNCTTIDLGIQYPAPARKGPFLCKARVARATGRTGFCHAEIFDANEDLVAVGQGVFRRIDYDMFA